MSYFIIEQTFLTPSFDLDVKEERKLLRFLQFLDDSGVAEVIRKHIKNNTSDGGRPNCNYYRLFATILYGFAFDGCTLRQLETKCRYDLRYIFLMHQQMVDHSTFARFIKNVITPNEHEIFALICRQIAEELGIKFEDAFIDGTKLEANANKYNFVWKPITFHKKLSVKANAIIRKYDIFPGYVDEEMIRSKTIAEAISNIGEKRIQVADSDLKALNGMLIKALEYEEKERICGPDRKSYYKTDKDATAMALKTDYYAGLGSHMHAAYNVQHLVVRGFVLAYSVSQARTDYSEFIPVLSAFFDNFGVFPQRVCADAGYGSYTNYKFLEENGIENYVKYAEYEGNVSGSMPEIYTLCEDGTITCLNGNKGTVRTIEHRHPRKKGSAFYYVEGCTGCPFVDYCKKFTRNKNLDFKIFEVNPELQRYRQQATENLLSVKGIEIRVNRTIQVEGSFGVLKQDYGRDRLRRRGLENVSTEVMLNALGMNIAKLFRFYETGKQSKFWTAPENLKPEKKKKPSAKILSRIGNRIRKRAIDKHGDARFEN